MGPYFLGWFLPSFPSFRPVIAPGYNNICNYSRAPLWSYLWPRQCQSVLILLTTFMPILKQTQMANRNNHRFPMKKSFPIAMIVLPFDLIVCTPLPCFFMPHFFPHLPPLPQRKSTYFSHFRSTSDAGSVSLKVYSPPAWTWRVASKLSRIDWNKSTQNHPIDWWFEFWKNSKWLSWSAAAFKQLLTIQWEADIT